MIFRKSQRKRNIIVRVHEAKKNIKDHDQDHNAKKTRRKNRDNKINIKIDLFQNKIKNNEKIKKPL